LRFHPVILCGGAGTRLWPASRIDRPKPFISLLGARSLFQETALRLAGLEGLAPAVVVTGEAHADMVERQLTEIGLAATLLIEPEGRDSAPALAAAAAWITDQDPEGIAVALASDHHIPDAAAFRAAVVLAGLAAKGGAIVTFGVQPTAPATAYGYIQPGAPLADAPGVRAVMRFVEKPDAATAQAYLAQGYLWNSGNFVYRAATLVEELTRYAPEVMAAARAGLDKAEGLLARRRLSAAFRAAPKISIDYAVMERTARAAVAPVSFAWSDIGAWDAVWAASPHDAEGNVVQGDVVLTESRDSLIRAAPGSPLVAGVGLRGIGVVVERDAILVCDLAASQGVKLAVDRLKAEGRTELSFGDGGGGLAAARARFETWLNASALPLWWAIGADHQGGGFREAIDHQGRPAIADRRARVQGRQIYAYATAGMMGWSGPWREAVDRGLDFFITRHRREDGLFRTLLHPDGTPADETAMLYDQAFALLALATAAQALPERNEALKAVADAALATLKASRAHGGGGFTEAVGETPFQANPHMHLLEAALAWCEAGGGAAWEALADEIVGLCLDRFIDARGALHESFDTDWRPSAGLSGRLVEPGHQFEWAWLLERWSRLRGRADAHAAAIRLFAAGEAGVDPVRGVAVAAMLDDLVAVHDPLARLWPQAEWLKAGLILAEVETDPLAKARQMAAAEGGAAALFRYFDTPVAGLWRDKLEADGRFRDEPAPASSLYHIVCAFKDLKDRCPG
jgi:mannose-1-phosphate guanylyltransferase/mannose-6-phosphate isomerase